MRLLYRTDIWLRYHLLLQCVIHDVWHCGTKWDCYTAPTYYCGITLYDTMSYECAVLNEANAIPHYVIATILYDTVIPSRDADSVGCLWRIIHHTVRLLHLSWQWTIPSHVTVWYFVWQRHAAPYDHVMATFLWQFVVPRYGSVSVGSWVWVTIIIPCGICQCMPHPTVWHTVVVCGTKPQDKEYAVSPIDIVCNCI